MLERYEWRHNGVLTYLFQELKDKKPETAEIYADLEGAKISGGTIPPNIVTTAQRPDLVIIDRSKLFTCGAHNSIHQEYHSCQHKKAAEV